MCLYVEEENLASIFGVHEIFYLEMKAVGSFEMSLTVRQTTRRHIVEGCSIHSNCL